MSKLLKLSKGFLTQAFNAKAEDRRINRALKNMNTYQLGQAIVNGIQNPQTGQLQKLTDEQRFAAERERLRKTAQNRPVPK